MITALLNAIKTLFLNAYRGFQADNAQLLAASISYYVLFSLFPLLIFLVGVTGVIIQDEDVQQEIIDQVLMNIPLDENEGRETVTDAVRGVAGSGSGALGAIGLLGMAWSGSAMFGVIRRSLNIMFAAGEAKRPFVQQKLVDLALVLGLGIFFLASILTMGFLRFVRRRSEELAGLGDLAEAAGFAWDMAAFFIPMIFSFMAFMVLYTVVPARYNPPRHAWPGALFAAVAFEAAKYAFAFYLENFSNYDLVFGSLGAVAAFLFWVYLSANIMLLGAAISAQYPHVRLETHSQPKLQGMQLPLRKKAWRTVKGLFVRTQQG